MDFLKKLIAESQEYAGELCLIEIDTPFNCLLCILPEEGIIFYDGNLEIPCPISARHHHASGIAATEKRGNISFPIEVGAGQFFSKHGKVEIFIGKEACDEAVRKGKIYYETYYKLAEMLGLEPEEKTELLEAIKNAIIFQECRKVMAEELDRLGEIRRGAKAALGFCPDALRFTVTLEKALTIGDEAVKVLEVYMDS